MFGLGKVVGLGLVALNMSACTSARTSPKAFDGLPAPSYAASLSAGDVVDPVVVAPEVADGWEFLYRFITETEFVLCLEGNRQDGRIVVDGFKLARMEASSVNSVRYQPCSGARYVGTAHNHPPVDNAGKSLCYQSEPDRRSFGMDQRAVVDVVLCGDRRFYWVMKDGRSGARTVVPMAALASVPR